MYHVGIFPRMPLWSISWYSVVHYIGGTSQPRGGLRRGITHAGQGLIKSSSRQKILIMCQNWNLRQLTCWGKGTPVKQYLVIPLCPCHPRGYRRKMQIFRLSGGTSADVLSSHTLIDKLMYCKTLFLTPKLFFWNFRDDRDFFFNL